MKSLRKLRPYLQGQTPLIVLALFLALASAFFKLSIPFLTGRCIDQMRNGDFHIEHFLYWMGGCLILGSLFRYGFDFVTSIIAQRAMKRMRDHLFAQLMEVPVSFLDRKQAGDLLVRLISDVETVQTGLITGAGALFEGIMQALITLGFMLYLHWMLALLVLLLTPISVIVSRFVSKRNSSYFKAQNKALGSLSQATLETLENIEAIHSYGLEEQKEETFDSLNSEYKKSSFKALFAASWINPSTRLVNNTIYAGVIILGACLCLFPASFAFTGVTFTVGALSAFLTYSYQYMTPFNEVADASSELLYASAALNRIDEVLSAEKDVDEGTKVIEGSIESLEAKDISFSYDGVKQILHDISFETKKGQKIALVGTTGCGKTTLINLLLRFYDPQEGHFSLNGESTFDHPKADLRSHLGMVLQETWLKSGTIKENIAYGKPDASEEEIIEAAKKAHADSFIRRLEKGYDTELSSGTLLSSGERQLLCVARILLLAPELVILDEATSSIALRTELLLAKAFDELMKGKTSIVVAHRLSTIRNADVILVMEEGRIVERGSFKELLSKGGTFASLYQAQLA